MVFAALAVALGAMFVRLGFWQLDRRTERRAANAVIAARLAQPEVAYTTLRLDSAAVYRRAVVRGVPDTAWEFWISGRSRNGSPGVHIMTPVRVPRTDTAVLVNRGWVYAPDAATADLAAWRERRQEFHGFVMQLSATTAAPGVKGRALRRLSSNGARHMLPYPVHTRYLVSQDSAARGSPARLPLPALDDGPHLSYAIQWFCFAAIALGGAAIVGLRYRDAERGARDAPDRSESRSASRIPRPE